ncbi:hypothetical protein, partial [Caldisericum sp.]|uniref:hypothetical protein n=1 Tax=Caldisericum sp. TaxID=2499687 RepID=UPI003D0A2927
MSEKKVVSRKVAVVLAIMCIIFAIQSCIILAIQSEISQLTINYNDLRNAYAELLSKYNELAANYSRLIEKLPLWYD